MVSVSKIITGAAKALEGKPLLTAGVSLPAAGESKALLAFGKKAVSSLEKTTSEVVQYRVKPDITMPVRPKTIQLSNPEFPLKPAMMENNDSATLGELGNVSLRLAKQYKSAEESARKEISEVFDGLELSVRSKEANSVMSKLKRMAVKGNKTIKTDEDARQIIQDAIGGRITLKDLTPQDVTDTINKVKINGNLLTEAEKNLVQRLFKNEKLTETERIKAEKLAKPVKNALAERHSEPAFKKFMLSGIKDALNRKVTTYEKLEKAGIRKDLIQELKSNPGIKPLRMTEVNNYKGINGTAYFSDNQIRQFERLQLATGEKFDIITCAENIDLAKYGLDGLPKQAKEAIKKSGYTTGQINVTLSDGTFAEIQVRGSGPFGEYEHIKYDAGQEKNTLGEIFQPYVKKFKSLTKDQKKEYDTYVSNTYDYYRTPELGIQSTKPSLPQGFDPILSEESMKSLHSLDKADQAKKMENFVPHIEYAA